MAKNNWRVSRDGLNELALANEAKRLGFDEVKWSVSTTVGETISQARPISELKRTLLIAAGDVDLVVSQVLGKGQALVLNEDGSVAYLLKAPADSLYEGTSIDRIAPYWRVLGTTSYTSFRGAKQAFLLEPVSIDIASREWSLAVASMVRPDGSVSLVNLTNDTLQECIDFRSAKSIEKIPHRTHLIAIEQSCAETFSRPPATICEVAGKVTFHGYAIQLSKAECAKAGGVWSSSSASTDGATVAR